MQQLISIKCLYHISKNKPRWQLSPSESDAFKKLTEYISLNMFYKNSFINFCKLHRKYCVFFSEADPLVGWSKDEEWRADNTYAAMVAKVRN
jgi:hypothetical protein